MAEEVRIDLKSTADTSGADRMGAAIGGLEGKSKGAAQGVEQVSKGSKDMARGLGEGAAAGNAAVAAMSNLSTASKGGAESIMAIARAGFAAGTSFKAVLASLGPIGIAAAAVGVALGVVSIAFKKSEDAAEEARKKLEEVNKTKLEALSTELVRITSGAEAMKTALDAANASAERISDAELADQLAANKISNLSPEDKSKNEVLIRRRREDEKRAAAQKILDDKAEIDASTYAETQRVANRELEMVADLTAKKDRLDNAIREKQSAEVVVQTGGEGGLGAGLADYERANVARVEFEAARKAAGDGIAVNLDAAVARATEAVKKIGAAAGGAINAQNKADIERFTQAAEGGYITRTRKSDDIEKFGKSLVPEVVPIQRGQGATRDALIPINDPRIRLGGGPLDQSQVGTGNQITRGKLAPGSDTINGAADKVADSAAKSESANAGAKDALGKIAEGSVKIAESQEALTTQITQTSGQLAIAIAQAATLGGENVQAYAELSATVRDLSSQMRTMQSQLAAARSRK